MTAVLLMPLAKMQFNQGGVPLNGGKLFTYIAGTTTKFNTYTSSTGSTANTNPIILDSNGQCDIWGVVGVTYKFVLSPSTDTDPPTNAYWTEDNIKPLNDPVWSSGDFSGAPSLAGTPIGQGTLSVNSLVEMTTTTVQSVTDEFALSINMISATGHNSTVANSSNKVALYAAAEAQTNSGNVWALNTVLVIDSGACSIGGVQNFELDVANNSGTDFGTNIVTAGLVQPASIGLNISGVGTNANSAAVAVLGTSTSLGGAWAAGAYLQIDAVNAVGILDEGGSTAPKGRIGYALRQNFTYGIDMNGATMANSAIRLGVGQNVVVRNNAGTADLTVIQTGTDNVLHFGNTTGGTQINGVAMGFFSTAPASKQTVTGSRGGNAALASLLTALATAGLITDSSS